MFPLTLFIFVMIEVLIVGYLDFKYKKIMNLWTILNMLIYLLSLLIFPNYYFFNIATFIWPLGFLIVGFVLFVLKIMGGGDSKFLFSFFLLIPVRLHEVFFLNLIYATIVVGFLMLIFNTVKNFDKLILAYTYKNLGYVKDVYGTKFAYAPIIGLSWMLFGWEIRSVFVY
jgi:prepilin peptidase CpaA